MKLKEKISIDEFDGKRFQIRLVEPVSTNEKKAVITHYLHNIDNGAAKHFKNDALKYIKEYVRYQEEENNLSLVAEDALQQLLFEVNDVPFPTPENYKFKFMQSGRAFRSNLFVRSLRKEFPLQSLMQIVA